MAYPTLRKFKLAVDRNHSSATLIPEVPAAVDVLSLSAGVAKTYNIPSGANVLVINGNDDYWVAVDKAAAIPVADNTAGIAPMYRPTGLMVYKVVDTYLSFIAPRSCLVSIWVFA